MRNSRLNFPLCKYKKFFLFINVLKSEISPRNRSILNTSYDICVFFDPFQLLKIVFSFSYDPNLDVDLMLLDFKGTALDCQQITFLSASSLLTLFWLWHWITNQGSICRNTVSKSYRKCIYLPVVNLCYIFSWNIVFSTCCQGMDSPPASFTVWKQKRRYFQMSFQSLSSFWKLLKTYRLACNRLSVFLNLLI